MMRALLAAMVVLPAALACSGGSSFPEPAECGTPAPLPTSGRTPGTVSRNTYRTALQDGVRRLQNYVDDFRGKYPSGNFSRQQEFRLDFADYADRTRCLASYMRDLTGPTTPEADATLDRALDDLLTHTEFGREAVRKRNVSDFRKWRDGVDAKVEAVRVAVGAVAS
jgi:hypothetical protein